MSDLVFRTAGELARLIRDGETSVQEVLEAHLRQIAKYKRPLNATVTLDEKGRGTAPEKRMKHSAGVTFGGRYTACRSPSRIVSRRLVYGRPADFPVEKPCPGF